MDFQVRAIREEELDTFREKLSRGFGGDLPDKDDVGHERFMGFLPLERTRAAFEGPEMVGTLGCFPFDLTVPGGVVPMGGTRMVTVQATHRRRGALRVMMLDHLADVRASGEPLAGLWPTESSIYGRFGFGAATERHEVELDAGAMQFSDDTVDGSVRLITADEATEVMVPIYERLVASRPGMLSRSAPYWKWHVLDDRSDRRGGMSARRYAIHRGPDGDDGYVMYRQKEHWEGFFSNGKVSVSELQAGTPAAHDALWKYVTSIDLFPNVVYWNQPVDDELTW